MGIDDAIARANEAEARNLKGRREQKAFEAKANQVVDELYGDFVRRLRRAGVKPQTVYAIRYRRTLFGKQEIYFDTGQKAWVVYSPEISERLGSNPWVAVTEEGSRIPVHFDTRKGKKVLRTWDAPPEEPRLRLRQLWVDAEETDKEGLKKMADETSEILAGALRRLGAV